MRRSSWSSGIPRLFFTPIRPPNNLCRDRADGSSGYISTSCAVGYRPYSFLYFSNPRCIFSNVHCGVRGIFVFVIYISIPNKLPLNTPTANRRHIRPLIFLHRVDFVHLELLIVFASILTMTLVVLPSYRTCRVDRAKLLAAL